MGIKPYNGEMIRRMTQLFQLYNTPAFNWLIEHNCRELIEAAEFIKTGKEVAFKWLVDNKHYEMAAFANAVRGDKEAFKWLMQNKSIFWAATANAVNKDKEALAWLKRNNIIVYAELAEAIISFNDLDTSDFSGYYRPPIR